LVTKSQKASALSCDYLRRKYSMITILEKVKSASGRAEKFRVFITYEILGQFMIFLS